MAFPVCNGHQAVLQCFQIGSGRYGGFTAKKRFGVFEFDPQARDLTKHGVRLKVQEQPLQIWRRCSNRPGRSFPARTSNSDFGPTARSWITSRA